MDAATLLRTLRERGFTLRVEGGTLYVGHRPGALSDELRSLIREQKAALLALLSAGEGQEEAPIPPAPAVPPDRILHIPAPSLRGGRSLTRPGGITLALSLRQDGACYVCGGCEWWLSIYGVVVCCRCHPPPVPELVSQYLDGRQAVLLARSGQK